MPGDLVVLPNDGGPITVFVSVGANLGVSAFSINPVDGGVSEEAAGRARSETDFIRDKKGGAVVPEAPHPRVLTDQR